MERALPKWMVVGVLWLWFALALATHFGARSPYSYVAATVNLPAARISGFVVNADAPNVQHATRFFYQAADVPYEETHNLKLPMHSMLVAAMASFVRSYALANYLVNLLALWLLSYVAVTLADERGISRATSLIAGLTCAALPVYAHYIGQPMQYVVGIAVNFLIVLAAVAGVRDPLRLGLLTGLLLLSYDPYVFLAALVAWVLWTIRWPRVRDYALYVALSLVPVLSWRLFLYFVSGGAGSTDVREKYLVPVLVGWLRVFVEVGDHPLAAFLAGHVGIIVAAHMTLALIYWPVLLLCIAGLLLSRPRWADAWLVVALAAFFLLEQMVAAAYDWENSPRRAIPLVLAVSFAYFYVVERHRRWRVAFVLVMLLSVFVTMSDFLRDRLTVGFIGTGQAITAETKQVLEVERARHAPMQDAARRWWDLSSARVSRPLVLAFANLFVAAFAVALLQILRERALVPRWLPAATGAALLASLAARFV